MAEGYSGTPLVKKLGYREGFRVALLDVPADYDALVAPLPPIVTARVDDGDLDLVHGFFTSADALEAALPRLVRAIRKTGMIWVSWPKRSSGVSTDLTEDVVRALALAHGVVDVKVCAVDATWSGLKLMIRTRDR